MACFLPQGVLDFLPDVPELQEASRSCQASRMSELTSPRMSHPLHSVGQSSLGPKTFKGSARKLYLLIGKAAEGWGVVQLFKSIFKTSYHSSIPKLNSSSTLFFFFFLIIARTVVHKFIKTQEPNSLLLSLPLFIPNLCKDNFLEFPTWRSGLRI